MFYHVTKRTNHRAADGLAHPGRRRSILPDHPQSASVLSLLRSRLRCSPSAQFTQHARTRSIQIRDGVAASIGIHRNLIYFRDPETGALDGGAMGGFPGFCYAGRSVWRDLGPHHTSVDGSARKISVGSEQDDRADADSRTAGGPPRTVEQVWIDKEAFGTSPFGLGLSRAEFWDMSEPEYRARLRIWKDSQRVKETMFAQLRADIHNSSEILQRKDKRRWEAADFGAKADPRTWKHPRNTLTPEELQKRLMMQFGEDPSESHGPHKKMHAVERLKATEQRFDPIIPSRKEA